MSKAKRNKPIPVKPNLSQKELVRAYARLHAQLSRDVRKTKKENLAARGKDPVAKKKYIDATRKFYAYVRLMELCQFLSNDVSEMRSILDAIGKASLISPESPN